MHGSHLRRLTAPALAASLAMGIVVAGLSVGQAGAAGTPGVTATQVTIGATVPNTGIASLGYNEVWKAANAVFKWVNAKGGINGRTIKYVTEDDCYGTPGFGCTGVPNTVTQTQKLLALPVFATVGSLGTPTQDSVRTLLKSHGVPQTFVNSGSPDWNNPKTYPMLFGWQPSYTVESKILAKYILRTYKGQKVCFIGQNDDFGKNGYNGLLFGGVKLTHSQFYNVAELVIQGAKYFTPFVQADQKAGCKVVFLDTVPGATAAVLGNALALSYAPHWVISSVGADPVTIKKELGATPDSEPGAVSFGYLPATTDTNPWNAWMYKVLLADPTDFPGFTNTTPIDGNMAYGIGWGVAFAEALRAEGRNVTRAGFVATLIKTSFQGPALTPLKYTATYHQGLNAGYIVTVLNDHQTGAVPGKVVYTTTSAKSSPVAVTHRLSVTVPTWLR